MSQSSFDQLQDAVTLKRDGRRLSLEGVLTGAALGILLIYLLDEAAATILRPGGGGPIDGPGDDDLGPFRTRVGSIPVAPLDDIVDRGPGTRRPPSSSDDAGPPSSLSAQGGQLGGFAAPEEIGELASGRPSDLSLDTKSPSGPGGNAGGGPLQPDPPTPPTPPPPPKPPPEPPPEPPEPPDPPPLPQDRPLQPLVLVLVRTDEQSTTRSLEQLVSSLQTPSQQGVAFSTINLEQARGAGFEVLSDRNLQGTGLSPFDAASLTMVADHAAMVTSQLFGGTRGDVVMLTARDLISLGLQSAADANASLQSETAALADSRIVDPGGNNLLMLQANTQLSFIGLGDSQRSSLVFDLLTQSLRDSAIALGAGDDTVSVISGFRGGLGIIGIAADTPQDGATAGDRRGLSLDLQDQVSLMDGRGDWELKLSATSIGLQDSSLSTGEGNDVVTISNRIDESLAADLGALYNDPRTSITLQRIALLRSNLDVGPGNDFVRISGAVIDSTIDLGAGNNRLILESPISGNSRILSDQGRNQITINDRLGGVLSGSSGDDRFDLNNAAGAGLLDGGSGNDSLASTSGRQRDLALIQGPNAGFLGGLQFREIENLDLGRGDDVALVSLEGSLSGRLLGGDGLDRLEFSNWDLPVSVDLDLGSATGLFGGARGGISGFEQVYGGSANDLLAASGLYDGLSGQEGDDVMFLRWSPWLSGDGHGLQLRGDGGADLFVIAGLESGIPSDWDGLSGIPMLTDLRLDLNDPGASEGDRLGWLRQGSGADGGGSEPFIRLTPSGIEGLGDARLLPIAPLEQLLNGMSDNTRQLAIAWDPSQANELAELRLLGSDGPGSSRLIAYVQADVQGRQSSFS